MPLLGTLPFEPAVGEADRSGSPLLDLADEFAASLDEFVTRLGGDPVAS